MISCAISFTGNARNGRRFVSVRPVKNWKMKGGKLIICFILLLRLCFRWVLFVNDSVVVAHCS